MFKEIWKPKGYKTWDEAFRALTPGMRQHSVRVADYTQVLFEGVCKSSFYIKDYATPDYANEAYKEVAYKCGFYHQIGKAYDPEEYPEWGYGRTDEEKGRYCKYAVEGRSLVARLQGEEDEEDISLPSKMIQEACESHLERWDGSGYPYGYESSEIPLIAQIVGLAKEFDYLICARRSENPFDEAIDLILAEEGKMFSPHLLEVFGACQPELKAVYKKYIQYTKMMPKTIPLVERRPERPFGLNYRQIVNGHELTSMTLEAVPWFGGVLDEPDTKQSAEETEQLLLRTGMTKDISIYFLYEAADMLARMKNCGLHTGGVVVPMFSTFYVGESHMEELEQLYENTQINKRKLILTVQESFMRNDRTVQERLAEYLSHGVTLVLDHYHSEDLPVPLIRDIGFTHVRIAEDSESYREGLSEFIRELKSHGITVVDWPTGDTYLTEDEMIRYLMDYE